MTDLSECPACGEILKLGAFKSNQLLSARQVSIINSAFCWDRKHACSKCGDSLFKEAKAKLEAEQVSLKSAFPKQISCIPLMSLQSPSNWNYSALGLVTAQSTTGTGIFSDIASAFTDTFGLQSGTYNQKIRAGEKLCQASLRMEALAVGGNAVLAVDVDYAEVGGQRAMLMVCMTGTAVRLLNTEVFGSDFDEHFSLADRTRHRLKEIDALKLNDFI